MLDLCKTAADHIATDAGNTVCIWCRNGLMFVLRDMHITADEIAVAGATTHKPDFGIYIRIEAIDAIELWFGVD